MSNEKPVRITVGDVKEVAEATAVQEPVKATTSPVSTTSRPVITAEEGGGKGLLMLAVIAAVAMLIFAGYYAMTHSAVAPNASNSGPNLSAPTAQPTPATNAPASGTASSNNAPANTAAAASNNAPAEASNYAPAAANNAVTGAANH